MTTKEYSHTESTENTEWQVAMEVTITLTITRTFAHSVICVIRVRQEVNLYFCSSVKETCSYVLLSKAFRMANASGVMRIRVICEIRGL